MTTKASLSAAVLGAFLVLWLWAPLSRAQDAPQFIVGQRIIVVWDCVPEWVTQLVSQTMANGQPLDPCFSEILEIRQVLKKDGWIVVTSEGGEQWTVNVGRAIGFRPLQPGTRVVR